MTFNLKNALLAGTAIVAVGAFAAQAQAADRTLVGNSFWGSTIPVDAPVAGDNVIASTFNLTVNNLNNVAIGAINSTAGSLIVTDSAAGSLNQTISSFASTSGGGFSVIGTDTNATNIEVSVTNGLATTGNVWVTQTETDSADSHKLLVGGAMNVGGTTTVGAGAFAGASSGIVVGGNATLTGLATVTSGAGLLSDASLTLNGATNVLTAGVSLDDDASGRASLILSGATAQTVTGGDIRGAAANEGSIFIRNANGVTFANTIGAGGRVRNITIDNTGALGSAATFRGSVNATTITLGGNSAGSNSITFDGSAGAFTVQGTIDGTATAAENNTINIIGGNIISQSQTWGQNGGNVDTLNITGAGTVLDSNAVTEIANTVIGSGAKLDVGAGQFTSSIANSGTVQLTGTGGVVGAISGSGLLDVDANATVTGNITQGSVTIATGTILTANGNITAPITLEGAGTLALSGAPHTITGNITTSGATGTGAITIADATVGTNTTAFVGNIGTADKHLNTLTVAANTNANIVSTTGNLFINNIQLRDEDVLSFVGTAPQTVSGTITDGDLSFANGSNVTFNGALTSIDNVTLLSLATATFNGVTGIDNVANAGKLNVNANTTVAGAYNNLNGTTSVAAGSTLTALSFTDTGSYILNARDVDGILTASDFGRLTDSAGASTIANSRLSVNLIGDIATGTAASVLTTIDVTAPGVLADNSFQYTFTAVDNGANTDILVSRLTTQEMSDQIHKELAAILEAQRAASLANTVNTQVGTFIDNIAKAGSRGAVQNLFESASPASAAALVAAAHAAAYESVKAALARTTELAQGNGSQTGAVAGDMGNGLSTWGQGFGKMAKQDRDGGTAGYEADTYGVMVGIDTANALEQGTVGAYISYANTDVDNKNANNTKTDIDSYQVALYGRYDVAPNTYVAGSAGYAWNDIDQTRSNVGGIAGLTAKSDFDSDQYSVYTEVGHNIALDDVTTLTPKILANYQHINIDSYTETGAGGLNLAVQDKDLDVLELGVGAEIAWNLDAGNGAKIRPALNAGYRYDVIGDDLDVSSRLTGAGGTFNTNNADPEQGIFNVGAALGYSMDNNWDITTSYDYEVKSGYDAHSGIVRATYKY